jgi:ABC-2 type transport system permease protein
VQGVLFGSVQAGSDMALDIERGFFDRLVASPVSRTSILVGRLGGAAAVGATQAALFTFVLMPFGATVESGPIGVVLLVIGGALVAVAFGGFLVAFAIKTGSAEAVHGAFPLVFVSLFLSSCFFPRETMSGWFKAVADLNPISYVVEGMRVPITGVGTTTEMLFGLAVVTILAASALTASLMALTRRLRRGS